MIKAKALSLVFVVTAASAITVSCGEVTVQQGQVFDAGESCTAYRVGKRMFLVNSVTVTGKNCKSEFAIRKEGGDSVIHVKVPVDGFVSGEPERDLHTAAILGGPDHATVDFVSDPVSSDELAKAAEGGKLHVKGKLTVAGKENPVAADVTFTRKDNGYIASGNLRTSFSANGLSAPKVAGGLIASVNDSLELHFQVHSEVIK